jgi:hypothetical protein
MQENLVAWTVFGWTHGPTAMTTKSVEKKCKNLLYQFWSPLLKIHFMYTDLNMIFLKFIMAGEISGPPKPRQYIPVGSQAHRVLNCFPKADELFIATELACESSSMPWFWTPSSCISPFCHVVANGILWIWYVRWYAQSDSPKWLGREFFNYYMN